MSTKRDKMLTLWVTQDEHQQLLIRCEGQWLSAWMRQTCLSEKPAQERPGKLPTLGSEQIRQLVRMGDDLNQIAQRVNQGEWGGHDRVQVMAALMAIDDGLSQLRDAVRNATG